MSALPARLVHQAADAIAPVAAKQMPDLGLLPAEDWTPEARAAVAAVLDTLAADFDKRAATATERWEQALAASDPIAGAKRTEVNTQAWNARRLRALAARVRETT